MADMVEIGDVDRVAGGATRLRHRSALPDSAVQRRADAELILATAHVMAAWESVSGRPIPAKPLRELVWTVGSIRGCLVRCIAASIRWRCRGVLRLGGRMPILGRVW